MEARIVPPTGFETAWIRFPALRGKGLARAALLPVNLLRAFWQAWRVLMRTRPTVVLGMGGYVSFPGGMMAALIGRPLVLHEQNAVAGLANRVLSQLADAVLTGFPDVLKKGRWVGNPVRADIAALPEPGPRYAVRQGPLRVLVVGGSLGAKVLNDTVPQALALLPAESRPVVVHQSGAAHLDALRAAYAAARVEAELLPFIDNMAERYAWADVVICRAGALTVAELAAAGVASILVPLPHAVDDHQSANARFLAEAGAATLIQQSEFTPQRLARQLKAATRTALAQHAFAARTRAQPQAAREVAAVCQALAAGPARKTS
jgi:UDP-N-acetylglucosamine--N-acetylmuramyl-(pentapeptide) pyrophosphoryl-undecaprenol N-acetylglucosamine transferase